MTPCDLPFKCKHLQGFVPINVRSATAINKAQGQTTCWPNRHLCKKCFSLGKLYVASIQAVNSMYSQFQLKTLLSVKRL